MFVFLEPDCLWCSLFAQGSKSVKLLPCFELFEGYAESSRDGCISKDSTSAFVVSFLIVVIALGIF